MIYGELTALHYAAYRPKLHEVLLSKCLDSFKMFDIGLDIGCGTGQSSVPLTKYCRKVIGIDPSEKMLYKAIPHPEITYLHMKDDLDIPEGYYDIISFAGSLFYCKSQQLYDKLITQSKNGTLILVYDYHIRLENILEHLDLNFPEEVNYYNHAENLSGLKIEEVSVLIQKQESISIPIAIGDLAHFILSHQSIYQNLVIKSNSTDIYHHLSKKLKRLSKDTTSFIQADLYYQKYEVIK